MKLRDIVTKVEFRNSIKSFSSFVFRLFKKPSKPFVYVAIGDSTVEGTGATTRNNSFASLIFGHLRKIFSQTEYHNFGKHAAKISDVLDTQLDRTIATNPDLIVISVGANDIFRGKVSPIQFRKRYTTMLKRLKSETHALIVVHNIPDVTLTRHVPSYARPGVRVWVKYFNGVIARATQKVGGVLVDIYSETKKIHGVEGLIAADGFHPNDRGYALWSDVVLSVIQPKIFLLRSL